MDSERIVDGVDSGPTVADVVAAAVVVVVADAADRPYSYWAAFQEAYRLAYCLAYRLAYRLAYFA